MISLILFFFSLVFLLFIARWAYNGLLGPQGAIKASSGDVKITAAVTSIIGSVVVAGIIERVFPQQSPVGGIKGKNTFIAEADKLEDIINTSRYKRTITDVIFDIGVGPSNLAGLFVQSDGVSFAAAGTTNHHVFMNEYGLTQAVFWSFNLKLICHIDGPAFCAVGTFKGRQASQF